MTPLVPAFGTRRTGYLGRKPGERISVGEPTPPPEEDNLPAVTHYAAPTASGAGDGSTASDPFLINDFWAVASPGDHLQLADGTYTGDNSMIAPPETVNGTDGNEILISAETGGGPLIDGEGVRRPVRYVGNKFHILQGVNCRNSDNSTVVGIFGGSQNLVLRQVGAWDGDTVKNGSVFAVAGSSTSTRDILLEDCFGFGNGRRIFNVSQFHRRVTLRRCWGMGSFHTETTKKVFQFGYQGYEDIVENCIATFDDEGQTNQPNWRCLFGFGRIDHDPDTSSQSKTFGNIGYILSEQGVSLLDQLHDAHDPSTDNEIHDLMLFTEQTTDNNQFMRFRTGNSGDAEDVSEIGDAGGIYADNDWTFTNRHRQTDIEGAWESPFQTTAGTGARVYYRYVDGVLQDGTGGTTETVLWPWPMDARIRAALTTSGRDPDTIFRGAGNGVTELMEDLFGTIPGI